MKAAGDSPISGQVGQDCFLHFGGASFQNKLCDTNDSKRGTYTVGLEGYYFSVVAL